MEELGHLPVHAILAETAAGNHSRVFETEVNGFAPARDGRAITATREHPHVISSPFSAACLRRIWSPTGLGQAKRLAAP
jgi:hypothetical protein